MFAIFSIGSKQYKVSTGSMLEVDHVAGAEGETVSFPSVLLIEDKGVVTVGTPTVSGKTIKAKIIKQGKGDKIDVYRYKSKVRRRRHIGFRPSITSLEITSIG